MTARRTAALLLLSWLTAVSAGAAPPPVTLLNASFDPTRELYQEENAAFAKAYRARTGVAIEIRQSHGGSGKQARSVIDGLEADVVTLALSFDVDALAARGLVAKGWQGRRPDRSTPHTSAIVFLVRKGNPKGIRDWDDLVRPGISVVTPNPKTSGGARWNYLAAWGSQTRKGRSPAQAEAFVRELFRRVPVLDSGARGSNTTFVQRGIGDVLLAWESEALLAVKAVRQGAVEVVVPKVTILAEPPVALVDAVVDRRGTRAAAEAYLKFLFTREGQEIAARHFFRPRLPEVASRFSSSFPKTTFFTIDDFGGWAKAHRDHFADGASFDRVFAR